MKKWLLLAATLTISGCTSANAAELITLTAEDLPPTAAVVGDMWQTSKFYDGTSAEWISFPGRSTLVIPHPLAHAPASIQIYLAFTATGESAAMAAGDMARITNVTTTDLSLNNATNQDFFVRVVAE